MQSGLLHSVTSTLPTPPSTSQCDNTPCINTLSGFHQQHYAPTPDTSFFTRTCYQSGQSSEFRDVVRTCCWKLVHLFCKPATHGLFPTSVGWTSVQLVICQSYLSQPFLGEPLTWQDSFYAATNVNPNLCLCGIQKLNYLKAQLQSDAAWAISGLPLSDLTCNNIASRPFWAIT